MPRLTTEREYNQLKVIKAMQENQCQRRPALSRHHRLWLQRSRPGYPGRGLCLRLPYARTPWCVRRSPAAPTPWPSPFPATCGPGDELLSPVGKPYDTLEEVIGIRRFRGLSEGIWRYLPPGGLKAGRHL